MAARRLLIVMLLLLGISTLGAALIPSERLERARTTTATEPPPPPDTLPRRGLVMATIRVGGRKLPVVRMKLGQQLILRVRAKIRDDVEIPKLGLTEAVEPLTPARFDLLPTEPGRYPIGLVHTDRTVAGIDVAAPPKTGRAKKQPEGAEAKKQPGGRGGG